MLAPTDLVHRLDRALELWRAPDSPWLRRLAQEHGGFSPEVIKLGVSRGVEHWTRAVFAALRERELVEHAWVPGLTGVWLAGSVPTATFSALLLPLLTGSAVWAKASSADPVTPALFRETLAEAGLPEVMRIAPEDELLREVDCLVAYGSDDTIEAVRRRLPRAVPFVGYGHKLSLAAVGTQVGVAEAAVDLALDLALWDGRGCLSPAYALVLDRPAGRAESFAAELARALSDCDSTLPRPSLDMTEEAQIREQRAFAALRPEGGVWTSEGSTSWTVAYDPSGPLPSPGALRFARVHAIRSLGELGERCRELSPHLSSIGHSGWGSDMEIAAIAAASGASRICPIGRMQLPPIDWNHDGMSPLRPMLRLTDVERGEKARHE